MTKAFFVILIFVSTVSAAQVTDPADKLARMFSVDMTAQTRKIVEQGLPNAPEKLTSEFSYRLAFEVAEYLAGEYKKRLTAFELTQLTEVLSSSAGQKFREINTEFAFVAATNPNFFRRIFSKACQSTSKNVSADQMALLDSTFCK